MYFLIATFSIPVIKILFHRFFFSCFKYLISVKYLFHWCLKWVQPKDNVIEQNFKDPARFHFLRFFWKTSLLDLPCTSFQFKILDNTSKKSSNQALNHYLFWKFHVWYTFPDDNVCKSCRIFSTIRSCFYHNLFLKK